MPTKRPTNRWFLSAPTRGLPPLSVDPQRGIIYGAAIVTTGEATGHGVSLDSEFVYDVCELGQAKGTHGVKVRFGHPNMSSTALGTFLGRAKNFRSDGGITRADLFLSNEAKETPHGNLHDYIVGMAQNEPDVFGVSIVFDPGDRYQRADDGEKVSDPAEWDDDAPVFVSIAKLHAADLVDDPAANAGLFSAWSGELLAGQVTEFLDQHPELLEELRRRPEIVDQFMARYSAYSKQSKPAQGVARMSDDTPTATTPEPTETTSANTTVVVSDDEQTVAEPTEIPAEAPPADVEEFTAVIADPAIPVAELERMCTDFGAEITLAAVLNGGGYDDAASLYMDALQSELEDLRQAVTAARGEVGTASFSDADPDVPPGPDVDALRRATSTPVDKMAAQIREEMPKRA